LGVSEASLRISLDPTNPDPTFDVLAAVIRVYGVDPTWLVTGLYDPISHRATLYSSDEHLVLRALRELYAPQARDRDSRQHPVD
jgi:hypothetical protein